MNQILPEPVSKLLLTLLESENQSMHSGQLVKKTGISASTWAKYHNYLEMSGLVVVKSDRDFDSAKMTWYINVNLTKKGVLVAQELASIGQLLQT